MGYGGKEKGPSETFYDINQDGKNNETSIDIKKEYDNIKELIDLKIELTGPEKEYFSWLEIKLTGINKETFKYQTEQIKKTVKIKNQTKFDLTDLSLQCDKTGCYAVGNDGEKITYKDYSNLAKKEIKQESADNLDYSKVITITDENFESVINKNEITIVIVGDKNDCVTCKDLDPVIKETKKNLNTRGFKNITIGDINYKTYQGTDIIYNKICRGGGIPKIALFKNGEYIEEIDTVNGKNAIQSIILNKIGKIGNEVISKK